MKSGFQKYMAGTMLAVFALLTASGIILATLGQLEHKSYLIELILSVIVLALAVLLYRRRKDKPMFVDRWSPWLTGSIITLICFAVNLAWVMSCHVEPIIDFYTNYMTAVKIANNDWIHLDRMYLALFPHIFGYAWFMSGFISHFGESALLIPIINVMATVLTGIMIYILCLHWMGLRSAALAYFLWALCPSKLLYNTMVLPEPIYTCAIFAFLLTLSLADTFSERGGSALWFVPEAVIGLLSGVVLFWMNMLRPLAAIWFIALFIWLLLLRCWKKKCLRPGLMWAVFILCMIISFRGVGSTWEKIENWRLCEEPARFPAYSIYVGLDEESGGSFSEVDRDKLMNYRYDQKNGSAVWAQEQMLNEVRQQLKTGSINVLRLLRVKLPKFLGSDEGGTFYSVASLTNMQFKLASALSNVFYYCVVLLSMYGAYKMAKEKTGSLILILPLFCVGLTLAHMIVEVAGRYKYCLIPMFIIIAAYASSGNKFCHM